MDLYGAKKIEISHYELKNTGRNAETGSVFGKKKPYKIIISLLSADDIIETHEFTGSFYKFQYFS